MADLNKVFLMGRLTFDPEIRYTPSGAAVAELRMATSNTWTTKDGERKEETLFVDVTVWNKQAENCCQYLRKGSGVHVEGSLKMDTWEDKTTGEKRSKIKISADRVQFLDRPPERAEGNGNAPARDSQPRRASQPAQSSPQGRTPYQPTNAARFQPDADDEDIPF